MVRLVDVDDDARRAGAHAQARLLGGWGGVAVALSVRPAGSGRAGTLTLAGEPVLTGAATPAAAERLVSEVDSRLAVAVRALDRSPADDPAWRRKVAARAALAVAVGAAAGIAGAAWARRRQE